MLRNGVLFISKRFRTQQALRCIHRGNIFCSMYESQIAFHQRFSKIGTREYSMPTEDKNESKTIDGLRDVKETKDDKTEASEESESIPKVDEPSTNLPQVESKLSNEADDLSDNDHDDQYLTTIFGDMEPYLDTYDIYTRLITAGFTSKQADEILSLLVVQLNLKLSKLSELYSHLYKLENERYLFESAQQELRVDVTRSREQHINELFGLINTLERDFNIISDELNNEFIQMKNNSQVALNDQKSENTLQSRQIMLKLQETNHKITTELNSAMKSEIESLRWHLSRWGVIAILVSVFSACCAVYIHKVKSDEKQTKNEFFPLIIHEPSEFDEDDYHTDLDKNVIS
ncbi:uncharacterized protein PRCAT00003857001 [Priceomyces carsonii]|uniref:uncharacterized protein n=1 Tax=Priceomyces carsonii TaxID=28549 RepID=UPI002ED9446B|nr:unnamed protein product [Priceomyces carsonii]